MTRSVNRSAATGRFVKAVTAARHPRTTVTQTVSARSSSKGRAYRSAITGRYVTQATAQRHPNTTITEGK